MEVMVAWEELQNTYKDKKIFVTGHTGFKGSWLLAVLDLLSAKVKGFSLAPENEPSLYSMINGSELCDSVIADVLDYNILEREIIEFQPDYIFHLAAQSLVRKSYVNPRDTFEVNAMGTANILDSVRRLPNKCQVIVITTDKVYENMEKDYAYIEDDKLGGFDPYSSSKACAELVAYSYKSSFFHPDNYSTHGKSIATARSGNVIGGGDWAEDRIVPDMIRAFLANEVLKVRNPKSVRPWQHVLEPLAGYLHLGCQMVKDPIKYADSYNFGPMENDKLTVEELIQIAAKKWGSGSYEVEKNTDNPHEAGLLQLNIQKAKVVLNWEPNMQSSEAIEKTVTWYKNYNENPLELTQNQIKEYFS